jgi:large subunit ribosomal protein L21
MFAVIKSGGRQYKVSVGQTLEVNRLPVDDGAQVKFEEVLLISDANSSMIGTPLVDNAMVLATAVKQDRGEKLIVFRYKAKKRVRHKRGHRQELTVLSIDDIIADGKSLITGKPPVAPEARETPAEDEGTTASVATEAEENEAPASEVSETAETETEQRKSRRRHTAPVEDTESKAEE